MLAVVEAGKAAEIGSTQNDDRDRAVRLLDSHLLVPNSRADKIEHWQHYVAAMPLVLLLADD